MERRDLSSWAFSPHPIIPDLHFLLILFIVNDMVHFIYKSYTIFTTTHHDAFHALITNFYD